MCDFSHTPTFITCYKHKNKIVKVCEISQRGVCDFSHTILKKQKKTKKIENKKKTKKHKKSKKVCGYYLLLLKRVCEISHRGV